MKNVEGYCKKGGKIRSKVVYEFLSEVLDKRLTGQCFF